jgi:hypothetical protein
LTISNVAVGEIATVIAAVHIPNRVSLRIGPPFLPFCQFPRWGI